ncbi:MAG: hypothetical protein EKK42_20225 [Pseudonocardiaceae bacterium]|nr:MAG: hypothetical protein EKK42_20225 [Pseudonocardiaceae bacterium]
MRVYREVPEDNVTAESLPVGTVIQDADDDQFIKGANHQWYYVSDSDGRSNYSLENWVSGPVRIVAKGDN